MGIFTGLYNDGQDIHIYINMLGSVGKNYVRENCNTCICSHSGNKARFSARRSRGCRGIGRSLTGGELLVNPSELMARLDVYLSNFTASSDTLRNLLTSIFLLFPVIFVLAPQFRTIKVTMDTASFLHYSTSGK